MTDDASWVQWAVGGLAGAGVLIATYLSGRISKAEDAADAAHGKAKDIELETTKLRAHVSENYSTKSETQAVEAKLLHAVERIHDRMDQMAENIRDIPQTIIGLLGKGVK